MSHSVRCPKCRTKFRVRDSYSGRKVACGTCQHEIQLPKFADAAGVESPAANQKPAKEQTSRIAELVSAASASTSATVPPAAESRPRSASAPPSSDVYIPANDSPHAASPYAIPPYAMPPYSPAHFGGEVPPRNPDDVGPMVAPPVGVPTSTTDLAFERTKITHALQWAALWVVMAGITMAIGYLTSMLVAIPLLLLETWICLVGQVSSLSYLTVQHVMHGTCPGTRQAWNFYVRRALGLTIGTVAFVVATLLFVGLLLAGIAVVSRAGPVGEIVGPFLVLPTFALLLASTALLCTLYLLPIIIGVEDCGIVTAFGSLRRTLRHSPVALVSRSFAGFLSLLPFILLSACVAAMTSVGAIVICGGEDLILGDFLRGPNALGKPIEDPTSSAGLITLGNGVRALSIAVIAAVWASLVAVYTAVTFTRVYCESALGAAD